jgi:hypothetical protein
MDFCSIALKLFVMHFAVSCTHMQFWRHANKAGVKNYTQHKSLTRSK